MMLRLRLWPVALLGLLCCELTASLHAAAARPARPPLPNILFILTDDLGYGDLGCYGQQRIKTPNIDRLAAEGMKFTSCYSGSTVCAPSRCALMTGLHTGHCRIRGNDAYPLQAEDVTVAEVLKPAGYRTALIGKWGLGLQDTTGIPTKQGFDDFVGFLGQTHAHQYYPTSIWRNEIQWPLHGNAGGQKKDYVHDVFTRSALNFIRINQEMPFFLYLAYTIPHAHNEMKDQGMEVPSDKPYSDETWPQMEKNKAAMITRLDRDIGLILAALKQYHLDTNTVVFFTSDNGPHKEGGVNPEFHASSGPLRGIKRDMYEGGIRVPMIVRWTGRIQAGSISDLPWAFWDFLPTAAEMAGVKPPAGLDGQSILPALVGGTTKPHEFFYWEFHERGTKQAVRTGDWKAVRLAPGAPLELYNLAGDLRETNNVAGANPSVVARIESYLKTARSESERWPIRTAKEEAEARKKRSPQDPVN